METRRILRLYLQGKSLRFISEYLGISRNTVTKYVHFFRACGVPFDDLLEFSDQQLDDLYKSPEKQVVAKLQVFQV